MLWSEGFEFFLETLYVLEVAVYACEAYVRDLVKLFELAHHQVAKHFAWYFFAVASACSGFDVLYCFFNLDIAYWSFFAGANDALLDFVSVKEFSCAVFFDDAQWFEFDSFICCESSFAPWAFSSSAGAVFSCFACFYDVCVVCVTEWTFQCCSPFRFDL
jgi:hypothetical protein